MGMRSGLVFLTAVLFGWGGWAGCAHSVRPVRKGADRLLVCAAGTVAWRGDASRWEPVKVDFIRETPVIKLHGLAPGPHRFQCVREDGAGAPPAGVDWIEEDGFGGQNGVLVVEAGDRGPSATLE